MKILYASGSKLPSTYANSVHVMKMCSAMARLGHQVVLVGIRGARKNDSDIFEDYGVDPAFDLRFLHWPRIPGAGGLLFAAQAASALAEIEPALVYGRHSLTLKLAADRGIPVVFESHGPPKNKFYRYIEQVLFRSRAFRRLIVISDALRSIYLAEFPWLDPSRVMVAHDAADAVECASGSTGDCLSAGYVGSLDPGRGMKILLGIAERAPEVLIHIVGRAATRNPDLKRLVALANVEYHGFVPHAQVWRVLGRMDVLLAPYENCVITADGRNTVRWMSPMKLFEYMAAGRAIVASDLPVIREVLTDGVNAVLVPPDDTDAWLDAIINLHNSGFRERLGRRAQHDQRTQHTWVRRARSVLEGL